MALLGGEGEVLEAAIPFKNWNKDKQEGKWEGQVCRTPICIEVRKQN